MPLTAAQIIAQAAQDAHAPSFTPQGLLKLNLILEELCIKHSFAAARGVYSFLLNPGLTSTVNGVTNWSGPYPLPLDYLRTSESSGTDGVQYSFFYSYNGVPYPLMPWDLGAGDMQVQQAGIQNLPYAYWTDMATESTAADRIVGTTTAQTAVGSPSIVVASAANMQVGHGVAGVGIAPGSQITAINGTAVSLSLNATGTFASAAGSGSASIMFGVPPSAYVYPGPSGSFPATLRYQQLKAPIVDTGVIPWFPDQSYLLERLTAELLATTDDERRQMMLANSERKLGRYEVFADDKTNRAQRVLLDRNAFSPKFSSLKNTKTVGW